MNFHVLTNVFFMFNLQFSWIEERKNIPAGKYTVRIFDEEGYADLRKVNICNNLQNRLVKFLIFLIGFF